MFFHSCCIHTYVTPVMLYSGLVFDKEQTLPWNNSFLHCYFQGRWYLSFHHSLLKVTLDDNIQQCFLFTLKTGEEDMEKKMNSGKLKQVWRKHKHPNCQSWREEVVWLLQIMFKLERHPSCFTLSYETLDQTRRSAWMGDSSLSVLLTV